jgi:hypothetical protein
VGAATWGAATCGAARTGVPAALALDAVMRAADSAAAAIKLAFMFNSANVFVKEPTRP